jgi:PAS domain S-box-containing protein
MMQESLETLREIAQDTGVPPRLSAEVLFVDDERYVLNALERDLRNKFEIRTALGAVEGLSLLEGGAQFAVVVSDLRMPEMDGLQFLDRVRLRSPDTARIILTGHADLLTVIQAVNSGNIFRFLQKPCSPEALEEGVRAGLRQYEWLVGERRAAQAASVRRANALTEMHREVDAAKEAAVRVQVALEQSDNRFRATFDSAPIGICLLTADGRIVESNDSLRLMFDQGRAELQGQQLAVCAHGDHRRLVEDSFDSLVHGIQDRCQFNARIRTSGGQIRWMRVTMCRPPIPTQDFAAIAMAEDITEERRLEEQLLHAQKMQALGRLAGSIAHDFNNLLTVIMGNIDLATKSRREVDDRIYEARRAADRATTLVKQLLMFSRKQVIDPQVIDVDTVVAEYEGMIRRLAGGNIDVKVKLGARGASVLADRGQFEQILLNLVVNSRDAMPNGGRLDINVEIVCVSSPLDDGSVMEPGEYVVVTTTDNGTGMSPEVRSLIFEPFFTTKDPGNGTGLGLSTVYGIVQQYGGHISVESLLGHGSTFRVYFPRESHRHDG